MVFKKKLETEPKEMRTEPVQVIRRRINPVQLFDDIVLNTRTTPLTSDTVKLTTLPDDFEMNTDHADSIAREVP